MHAAFLRASSRANEIVAVHDPSEVRSAAFASRHGARSVQETELLDVVDAVYVTTWTAEHPRLVALAAERGIPLFCEKPLAVDAIVAQEMVEAVERSGVVNQVGLLLRFAPHFLLAHSLVRDPSAGRLLAVSFRDDQYIPNQGRYASTWRTDPKLAGRGALLEHSIHDVDVMRWIGGEVSAVSGAIREFHGYPSIDDVAVARLEFRGGGIASLVSVWHDILERPSMRHVEVFCERLHIVIDGDITGKLRWQYTGSPPEEVDVIAATERCLASRLAPVDDVVSFLGGQVFNPASMFLDAVNDRESSPLPVREALTAHRIVDAIYQSADGGGNLHVQPEQPRGATV
jgi:predicted dehydrogenase